MITDYKPAEKLLTLSETAKQAGEKTKYFTKSLTIQVLPRFI